MATDIASGAVSSVRCDVNSGVGGARTDSEKRADEHEDEAEDSPSDRQVQSTSEQPAQPGGTTPTVVATDTAGAFATVAVPLPPAETSDSSNDRVSTSASALQEDAGLAASVAEMSSNDEASDDAAAATTARLVDDDDAAAAPSASADATRLTIEQDTLAEGTYVLPALAERLRDFSRPPRTTCENASASRRRTRVGGPNETRDYF